MTPVPLRRSRPRRQHSEWPLRAIVIMVSVALLLGAALLVHLGAAP